MATRVESGHYIVREESFKDEKKSTSSTTEYGVVRGDTANGSDSAFRGQFGFKSSKWYAYKLTKTNIIPRLTGFSPTAPTRAFEQHFSEFHFAQEEFDSKGEAVDFVEGEMI